MIARREEDEIEKERRALVLKGGLKSQFFIFDSGKLEHAEHFFLLKHMSKIALKRDIPL